MHNFEWDLVTIFQLESDESGKFEFVRVLDTKTGKGVFAVRDYPADSVIGEIKGRLFSCDGDGTEYTFDADNGMQFEPNAPFRFLNHSCDANCEFDWVDVPEDGGATRSALLVFATRIIRSGEQLTIDYNWPASSAIECNCEAENCRGWIVDQEELGNLEERLATA